MTGKYYSELAAGDTLHSLQLRATTTAVVAAALATRDYSPLHHDYRYATEVAGHQDIFLNTMHQAALFQRLLTDNLGPRMRLGRLRIAMQSPVYAGALVTVTGMLKTKQLDTRGCGWCNFELAMQATGELASSCWVSCAVPVDDTDNPWRRRGEEWQP